MNKTKWSSICILFAALIGITIVSCKKQKAATNAGTCDPTVTYFSKDVLPILLSNCSMSGCHTGKLGEQSDLTNYYKVMKIVSAGNPSSSKLYTIVQGNSRRKMPPNGSLTQAQIDILYNWIAQGAKNEVCDDNGLCDTSNIKYSTTVSVIISNNCNGCHGTTAVQNGGGVVLSDYPNLATQIANGNLMGDINFVSGHNAMPKGGNQLSSCDRNKIQQWINRNYPNN